MLALVDVNREKRSLGFGVQDARQQGLAELAAAKERVRIEQDAALSLNATLKQESLKLVQPGARQLLADTSAVFENIQRAQCTAGDKKLASLGQKEEGVSKVARDYKKALKEDEKTALYNARDALKAGLVKLKGTHSTARVEIAAAAKVSGRE